MPLSQVKTVFTDNYKKLVENWIAVNNILNDVNYFLLRVLKILISELNRFRHLHFNYFKVKTTFNRGKENKKKAKN